MTTDQYTYENTYSISTRDADFKKDLRISSLVNFYIQAAWKHAEELGFGYSHLSKTGIGWILSRFKIKIHHLPSWPGDVIFKTWPKGTDRIFFMRDAQVFSPDNKMLASITSAWLVIDIQTKRPKRSLPSAEIFNEMELKHAINESIPSLCFEGEPIYSCNFTVRSNDIDMNMHLTTIRYIDFMFDTYDLDFLNINTPIEIIVNFIKEVAFGADLIMKRFENANVHSFELVNKDTDIVCFRGELKYSQH